MAKKSTGYSRVADLFIPIYNYEPFHRPSGEGQDEHDGNQIRREKLLNVLAQTLNTNLFAGVYLITGFRGSGKTSLVKRAIKEFKDSQSNLFRLFGLGKKEVESKPKKLHSFILFIPFILLSAAALLSLKWSLLIRTPLNYSTWVIAIFTLFIWLVALYKLISSQEKIVNWFNSLITIEHHIVVENNLSGQKLTSFDVLKNLTWNIYSHYTHKKKILKLMFIFWYLLPLFATLWLPRVDFVFELFKDLKDGLLETFKKYLPFGRLAKYTLLYLLNLSLLEFMALALRIDPAQRKNLRRLKTLNQRISANELPGNEYKLQGAGLSITNTSKRNYLNLTEKEIAFELKEIIDNAQSHILFPVKFIFVIDELDKLEAAEGQKANSTNEQIKNKKELIFTLLGELKHFFVSAKAKFYFISGSEMFDAALADTTERDAYLGSIFHKVIYVPSLLSDFNNHTSNMSAQVEKFVCQFLSRNDKTCTTLNDFFGDWRLRDRDHSERDYNLFDKENYKDDPMYDEMRDQRHVKHYYILKCFITYLTFRSKGSPKRMVSLFEEYLMTKLEFRELQDATNNFNHNFDYEFYDGSLSNKIYKTEADHVLVFDEADQYKLGLNSFLNAPFFYSFSTFIANHSDKQIISTLFLWDHIFKYHNAAFSRHHLEYIYEIISTSKEPDIHKQLNFLISLSKGRWLREIRSGLFDFKFSSRLRNEIRFLSNTNQSEAAVYNFTLDESENLKGFYKALLVEADTLNKDKKDEQRDESLRGFILRILGDLNYFDQEYDKANVYYELAVKPYLSMDSVTGKYKYYFSHNDLVSVVRWMLLLSLTYEKNKHFTKAYAICKDIDRILFGIPKGSREEYIDSVSFSKILSQLMLQKLMLLEKTCANGIQLEDVENAFNDLKRIYIGYNTALRNPFADPLAAIRNNSLLKTETYHKITNVFFFRNTQDNDSLLKPFRDGNADAMSARLYLHNILILDNKEITQNEEIPKLVNETLKAVESLRKKSNFNYLMATADYLSKAGNALLTYSKEGNSIKLYLKDLKTDNKLTDDNYLSLAHKIWYQAFDTYKYLACYGEAAEQRLKILYLIREVTKFYEGIKQADLELRKTICSYITTELIEILSLNHDQYDNNQRVYVGSYNYEAALGGLFASAKNEELLSMIQAAPNAPDAVEAIVVYMEILLKMNIYSYNPIMEAYINSINKYSIVQSQYVRVMELHFKAKYNFRKFNAEMRNLFKDNYNRRKITYSSFSRLLAEYPNKDARTKIEDGTSDFYDYCIDSIYCLLEVLRITNTQRNDFMIGHSFTGAIYKKLAWWGIVYRGLFNIIENIEPVKKDVRQRLRKLVNEQNEKIALFPKYNFEKAIGHFQLAIQTHQRGTPYKEMIHQLFALEDDLNDEFTHFMLALDRMRFVNDEFNDKPEDSKSKPEEASIERKKGEIEKTQEHLNLLIKEENDIRGQNKFDSENDWLFDLSWLTANPVIKSFVDTESKTSDNITVGKKVVIEGQNLEIYPQDKNQGVFLFSVDGSITVNIEELEVNQSTKLQFVVPDLKDGSYWLEVRVASGNEPIRTTRYSNLLKVQKNP
jgi:hypothetical protein